MDRLSYIREQHHVAYQEIEEDSLMMLKTYADGATETKELNPQYRNSLIVYLERWGFIERVDPLSQAHITTKGSNAITRGWVYDSQWVNK